MLDAAEPLRPDLLGPGRWRPELVVDNRGVYLADADGNLVGLDGDLGRGGPLGRLLYAGRSATRDL